MGLRTPFVTLIEEALTGATTSSMNALALKWGVPAQYVSRWRYDDQLPELWRLPLLAEKIGLTVAGLERCWFESAKLLSEARRAETGPPPVGERRRANLSLPPVRIRNRRRGKLAAWAFLVASGSALGQPLGAASPRPIMMFADMAPPRGILSRWRRIEAA
jgi:hypothetical protein